MFSVCSPGSPSILLCLGGSPMGMTPTGLPCPTFHLISVNGEIERNQETKIRVFILLAELKVRSPALTKACPSLNDDLFCMISCSLWLSESFSSHHLSLLWCGNNATATSPRLPEYSLPISFYLIIASF